MPCAKASKGKQPANRIKKRSNGTFNGLFLSINNEWRYDGINVHAELQHDEVAKILENQPLMNTADAIFKTEDAGGEVAPLKWEKIALCQALQQMPEEPLMTKKM
jgi:hypothetical protein